ncbi:hypothetical protein RDV89_16460 [Nocardioides zeae]|uniref:A9CJY8-like N-terminal domain-containing protein n=1 Tax=Nocardioides imazamoxiresistens TaxID=3231893 RepID=A0ABU3PZJ8_9ACTN|nr:hypothetical protein [Nocardioides zeae]MDT9594680.1 hypothetical protein [Nocardioides zeae]
MSAEEQQETPVQQPDDTTDTASAAATDDIELDLESRTYTIARFPEKLALVRLGPGADIPTWAESSSVFSITATATETAVLCAGRNVPTKARGIKPLVGFQVPGPIDFADGATVLVALLAPLVEAGIPATTATTVDGRWVIVRAEDSSQAEKAWKRRGHEVAAAVPAP